MSSVGVKIANFSYPVCNSFEAKILNDQLCYEVDLNRFVSDVHIERYIKFGFNFLMDYNEDRQVIFDKKHVHNKGDSLAKLALATKVALSKKLVAKKKLAVSTAAVVAVLAKVALSSKGWS